MQTSNFNSPDSRNRKRRGTAIVLGAIAAVGVAGALGLGFVLGGGNDGSAARDRIVSAAPDASPATSTPANGTSAPDGGGASSAPATGSTSDADGGGGAPPPPPATSTPVPPATETPVPPTATPTAEPEPTDTPTATPTPGCVFCIDPDILGVIDLAPPAFESGGRTHCPEGTIVAVTLDEDADIWVEYTFWGLNMMSETDHGAIGYFNLGGGPILFPAMNIVVHAKDSWGNESTFNPPLYDCP